MSDLISREALIDALEKEEKVYEDNMSVPSFFTALSVIRHLPTIEAVPVVHGEWERIPYSFVGGYRCSCCGQKTLERHWNFCPNCGADMRKKV